MDIAVITGASTGIGFAAAVHFARNGYKTYAGLRNLAKAEPLEKIAAEESLPLEVLQLDVTDDASVKAAFAKASAEGPIEVLVNNAGIGGATPLELVPMDEHRQMFETNYFGAIRCIQEVVGPMRERRSGAIVNITSVEGRLAVPNQGPYSASKWALECIGESLAHELCQFGVRVTNVEPGVIMTNIFENSAETTRYDKTSPYKQIMRRNGKMFSAGFRIATQPEAVAATILESVTTDDYRLRWPVGPDAHGMIEGRARITDEDWVAMGAELTDEEYNGRYKEWFGIDL